LDLLCTPKEEAGLARLAEVYLTNGRGIEKHPIVLVCDEGIGWSISGHRIPSLILIEKVQEMGKGLETSAHSSF